MAIRITDSVKPGYNRTPLDLIGKSAPPETANKIGSPVMNQAQALVRSMASLASIPPTVGQAWGVRRSPTIDNRAATPDFTMGMWPQYLPQYTLQIPDGRIMAEAYPRSVCAWDGNYTYLMIVSQLNSVDQEVWACRGPDGNDWARIATLPCVNAGFPYIGLFWANGQWVAYCTRDTSRSGDGMSLATSPDGFVWTRRTTSTYKVVGIAWNGTKLVAAHEGVNAIMQSTDNGVTWSWITPTGLTGSPVFKTLAYLNGYFYAVRADANLICRSTDGVAWTEHAAHSTLDGVAWNGYEYVAWTSSAQANAYIYTSPNGTTWTSQGSGPGFLDHVVGFTHSRRFIGVQRAGKGAGGGAVAQGKIYQSENGGATWIARSTGVMDLSHVCFNSNYGYGLVVGSYGPQALISTDQYGVTWTPTLSLPRGYTDICYANGKYVAVAMSGGTKRAATSTNGVDWTRQTTPNDTRGDSHWMGVAHGAGLFVAIGGQNGCPTDERAMTSPDGVTWTLRMVATMGSYCEAKSICFGTKFVAVGSSTTSRVYRSDDGITWDYSTASTYRNWVSVTYGNGVYVAVSTEGYIQWSADAITWHELTPTGGLKPLRKVAFGNGTFVAVSSNGYALRSGDGINWTPAALTGAWYGIAYIGGLFVAVGQNPGAACVATSPDGAVWTTGTTLASANHWCGIAGDGTANAVAVADDVVDGKGPFMTYPAPATAVSARYFRIESTGYCIAIEIELKDAGGTNHALASAGSSATASDIIGAGSEASRAIDGTSSGDGGWKSLNNGSVHWIEIDLGQVRDITTIKITPRNYNDAIQGWEHNVITVKAGLAAAPTTVVRALTAGHDFPRGAITPFTAAIPNP